MWVYLVMWILECFSALSCHLSLNMLVGVRDLLVEMLVLYNRIRITDRHVSYRLEGEVINDKVIVVQGIKCPFKPSVNSQWPCILWRYTWNGALLYFFFSFFLPYFFVIVGTKTVYFSVKHLSYRSKYILNKLKPWLKWISGRNNPYAKIPKSKFHVLPVWETEQSMHNLYNHRKAIKRFNFNSEIRLSSPLPLLI